MIKHVGAIQLSVIIPAYNAGKYIEACLQSVVAQSDCSAFEIIVVDDGSSDGTSDIIQNNFPDVKLFHKCNGGPGSARNLGAAKASGEILIFLDADDIMLPGRLAVQGEFMLENLRYGLSFGNQRYELKPQYDHNKAAGLAVGSDFTPVTLPYQRLLIHGNQIPNTACAVRRSVFLDIGGQREDIFVGEDYGMNCAIARQWPIAASCRFLTWYRQGHSNNLMASEHTYRGPVVVLMEELLSHGHRLKPQEYAMAHKRWCRLANMLIRRVWADFGRTAALQEMATLRPLLPSELWWKWQMASLIPPAVGCVARDIKRLTEGTQRRRTLTE